MSPWWLRISQDSGGGQVRIVGGGHVMIVYGGHVMIVCGGHVMIQGDFFNWSPPKFSKYKSLYNLWHLEKFQASLHGILYLENLGGSS